MDKLKPALDFMKKFGFWFLLGLTVVVVLGCWWMATASVAKEIKDKKTTIEKNFTEVSAIANATSHPNQTYLDSLQTEQDKLKEKVLTAWKTLYDQQQKNNPWPKEIGDEFLDTIKNLKPNEEIPYKMRARYMTFIQDYFPTLEKEVDLRQPKKDGGAKGNANASGEMEGIVDWDVNDINRLKAKLNWQTPPSDIKLRLTQEDLWVILSLLRVIKNTNDNVTEHSKAAIKHIDSLDIGPAAVVAWRQAEGKVFRGGETAGGGGAAGAAAGAPGGPPATTGGAAGAAQSEKEQLMFDRYVDDKGNPLTGDPNAAFAEFKMMPIRMKLYIDQRKIAKLLVECANSAMPIEIRRVRIRPDEGEVVNLGGEGATGGGGPGSVAPMGAPVMAPGYGTGAPGGPGIIPPGYGRGGPPGMPPGYGPGPMPGYGPGMMRGGGGNMQAGGAGGAGAFAGATATWDKGAMDIPIEIQGIICIYNPPNKDKLGTGNMGQTPAAGETPAGTTPGATPATPPAAAPATGAPATAAPVDATAPQATPVPAATPATQPATQPGAQPETPAATPAGTPAATPAATPPAEPAKAGN